MLLGALLGYLFYWSGSLWIPIVAHAFNNGAQVLLAYLHDHQFISFDITSEEPLPITITIVSSFICVLLLWFTWNRFDKKRFIF
jgi:membrane protease YdiL (CAAX protease family)